MTELPSAELCPLCNHRLAPNEHDADLKQCTKCMSPFTQANGKLAMLAAPEWIKEEALN